MFSSKAKVFLHTIVNVGGNIILMDVVPPNYKALSLLVFNICQVLLAYFDPSYALVKLGRAK